MRNVDLQLADQVMRTDNPTLGICTVKQIKDHWVTFYRPYTHTADFSHTGGVICYTGVETWKEEYSDERSDWTLVTRKVIK